LYLVVFTVYVITCENINHSAYLVSFHFSFLAQTPAISQKKKSMHTTVTVDFSTAYLQYHNKCNANPTI